MWCAYCTQEITAQNTHDACRDPVWFQMSKEFTQVKMAFMKQYDPDLHKGETVEVRNGSDPV